MRWVFVPGALYCTDCLIYSQFLTGSMWRLLLVGVARKIALSKLTGYNEAMNWNPLYPSNDQTSSLDEAIREAEWEDDMRQSE